MVPGAANGISLPWAVVALLLVAATALTMTIAGGRWIALTALGLLATDVGCAVYQEVRGATTLILFDIAAMVTSAMLCLVVGEAVFRSGPFNVYRVVGTIVFYLNIGLLFGFAHRLVGQILPGSYDNLPTPSREAAFRAAMDYYSFMTLTLVGYGDVVPVAPIARGISMLEAVLGQLLPVLLISRAVSKMDNLC